MMTIIVFVIAACLASTSALDLHGKGRTVNGKLAKPKQFPYQVYIVEYPVDQFCGASLISTEWVLTVAICTFNATKIDLEFGSTTKNNDDAVKRRAYGNNIITHPNFDPDSRRHDIGLIRIDPVTLTDRIKPVKLPKIASFYPDYIGEKVVIAGWGTSIRDGRGLHNLEYFNTVIVPTDFCRRKRAEREIRECMICTSTVGNVHACGGDVGGAVVLASTQEQIGISTDLRTELCNTDAPNKFVRVTSYIEWIREQTGIED